MEASTHLYNVRALFGVKTAIFNGFLRYKKPKKKSNPNHNFSCLYWMKMISAPLNDLEGKTTIFSYYFALFFNWVKF